MTYRIRVIVQDIPVSFLIIKQYYVFFTACTSSKLENEVNPAKTQPN